MNKKTGYSRLLLQETAAAGFLFVGFLGLYIVSLSSALLTADNGEFQLVGALLGVAHPPGFPLYTMLAHSATYLPFGPDPAWRINFLSAVISALTLLLVYLTTRKLTGSFLTGSLSAAALATSTTFWAQATTANVRSLTAFFAALAIFILIQLRTTSAAPALSQEPANLTPGPDRPINWSLPLLALTISLGLTHHLSLVFMTLIVAVALLWHQPALWREAHHWLLSTLAAGIGLLPLLYLPWRTAANAFNAPPDLNRLNGFLNHVLARGFQGDFFYFIEPALLLERLLVMGNVLSIQFNNWLLLAMVAGFFLILRRDRWLAFLLGGSFLIHTFITATYRAPQTVEYMLPAYIPLVICLGTLIGPQIGPQSPQIFRRWPVIGRPLLIIALVTAVLLQALERYPGFAALSQDETARSYAEPLLRDAPPESLILADWHWVTPLWYLQKVEGQRPDLLIEFVYPTAEPYEETWARRINEGLANDRNVVATHFHEIAYASLSPSEPIGEAFLFRQQPRQAMPAHFQPLALQWQHGLRLVGSELPPTAVAIGEELVVTLAWEMANNGPTTLFLHLVGFDGRLYAQQDLPLPTVEGIGLTQFRLTPRPGTPLGDLVLFVGAYDNEPILLVDGQSRVQLATITATPSPWKPVTRNPLFRAEVGSGRVLTGYDWDSTLPGQWRLYLHWRTAAGYWSETIDTTEAITLDGLRNRWGLTRQLRLVPPANSHYVPLGQGLVWTGINDPGPQPAGQTFAWRPRLEASQPVLRDLVISVALIGFQPDGFHWAWRSQDDSVPAMGGIPTLKWIAGTAVTSPHWLTVDGDATPDQAMTGTLILYDAFTQRPLPILDERLTQETQWIPLTITWPR